tara:strand:- start:229 stop:708 length:480 start_codon:yes stop_codon:yes gene_type:complete
LNIKKLAYINEVTGEIEAMILSQGNNPPEGLNEEGTQRLVYIYDNIPNNSEFMELNYYTTEFVERPPRINPFATWNKNTTSWEWNYETFLNHIREQRDRKLYQTDWTQLSDTSITPAQVSEAAQYRQLLRDLTNAIVANPENFPTLASVSWPVPPTFIA